MIEIIFFVFSITVKSYHIGDKSNEINVIMYLIAIKINKNAICSCCAAYVAADRHDYNNSPYLLIKTIFNNCASSRYRTIMPASHQK